MIIIYLHPIKSCTVPGTYRSRYPVDMIPIESLKMSAAQNEN